MSDTPVVTFILDASASMDMSPEEEEGCDYRMDKTKALFHDFVQDLPDECLMHDKLPDRTGGRHHDQTGTGGHRQ